MPRKSKTGYKFLDTYVDRHGKQRVYFNRRGQERKPLPAPIGSPAFLKAYEAALRRAPDAQRRQAERATARALNSEPRIGVYLLLLDGQIVYVGSSLDVPKRIATHRTNGRAFDKAYCIGTTLSERVVLERALIAAIQPTQNRYGVKTRTPNFLQDTPNFLPVP